MYKVDFEDLCGVPFHSIINKEEKERKFEDALEWCMATMKDRAATEAAKKEIEKEIEKASDRFTKSILLVRLESFEITEARDELRKLQEKREYAKKCAIEYANKVKQTKRKLIFNNETWKNK